MLVKRLKDCFELNTPIFTYEILEIMNDYSRPRIYQMINEAEKNNELLRYDNGIYYLPKKTEFGYSLPSINSVIEKKYIKEKNNIYGIYGKNIINLNFLVSYQVPNIIEIITNNESRRIREINIRDRKIILRKSRCKITAENEATYTLMELFNNLDIRQFIEEKNIQNEVSKYIRKKKIKKDDVLCLAKYFPAKVMKNLALSGILYEIA